jgi:hypothetical protein
MASEDAAGVSTERTGSLAEQPKTSLADEQAVVSMEVTSEQDVGSDGESPSEDNSDSKDASDNVKHVKIGAEAALVDVSYDFGQSKVTKARITSLESYARYFPKGFTRPAGVESAANPREYKAVVFKDFFATALRIPLHQVLLDILHKFQVQLYQLTPNAIF